MLQLSLSSFGTAEVIVSRSSGNTPTPQIFTNGFCFGVLTRELKSSGHVTITHQVLASIRHSENKNVM